MVGGQKTDDDKPRQQTSNHLKSKDKCKSKTTTKQGGKDTSSLSGSDSSNTADGPRIDKPDDKLSDKNNSQDQALKTLVAAWPELPETFKAGILAMVQAFARKEEQ